MFHEHIPLLRQSNLTDTPSIVDSVSHWKFSSSAQCYARAAQLGRDVQNMSSTHMNAKVHTCETERREGEERKTAGGRDTESKTEKKQLLHAMELPVRVCRLLQSSQFTLHKDRKA